jgi:gamma-carbonic anhydrase
MVAAGSVVEPGAVVPSGQLWGGNPAKFLRDLKPEEKSFMLTSAKRYAELGKQYLSEAKK